MRAEPDADPTFAALLVEDWAAAIEAEGRKPTALGSRTRFSDAGGCERVIGLDAIGVPESDPIWRDLASVWSVTLGRIVHEHWQAALQRRYPDAQVEVKAGDATTSGHSDASLLTATVHLPKGGLVVGELKTMHAGNWDWCLGIWRSPGRGQPPKRNAARGPKADHVLQLGMNADAQGADGAVLAYACLEPVPKGKATKLGLNDYERFLAQWTLTPDDWAEPVAAEKARIARILGAVDDGYVPMRVHPDKGMIDDPDEVDFPCPYCRHLDNCRQLGTLASVEDALALARDGAA